MKQEYTLKFEFYGRNMKTIVKAETKDHAKAIVRNRLKFLEVKAKDDIIDYFNEHIFKNNK